jgi:ABC-type microcin C transport system duplicated ATPase subunit YejF
MSHERQPILAAAGLTRHFGSPHAGAFATSRAPVRAVENVDLTVGEGEAVGLLGESGCGKTTLSRMLLLLSTPTRGHVLFHGRDMAQASKREMRDFRRAVQPVFQDPYSSLDPRMSVGRIVAEPLAAAGGITRAESRARVADALRQVELDPADASRYPREFSGGQRQRIALARALVSRPQVIVLDEAVSSQDVSIRAQLLNLLKDIQREQGVSYLFISHDLSVVRFLCDRIYVMYRGAVVENGAADAVYGAPQHAYTRSLLESWLGLPQSPTASPI